VENHGVEKIVTLRACDHVLRATVPARTELTVDSGSTFCFNQAKLQFFDVASGSNIFYGEEAGDG
jgi:multiple sugar transport system ATP-binding protein